MKKTTKQKPKTITKAKKPMKAGPGVAPKKLFESKGNIDDMAKALGNEARVRARKQIRRSQGGGR